MKFIGICPGIDDTSVAVVKNGKMIDNMIIKNLPRLADERKVRRIQIDISRFLKKHKGKIFIRIVENKGKMNKGYSHQDAGVCFFIMVLLLNKGIRFTKVEYWRLKEHLTGTMKVKDCNFIDAVHERWKIRLTDLHSSISLALAMFAYEKSMLIA